MTERESLIADRDDERLERISRALTWVPLSHYDEVQKLAEIAVGGFIAERDRYQEQAERYAETLRDIDAVVRLRRGDVAQKVRSKLRNVKDAFDE